MAVLLAMMLAQATQGVGPRPLNPDAWRDYSDSVGNALSNDRQGTSYVALTIDATGRPVNCAITRSSGFRAFDQKTCFIYMNRIRFAPARDEAGAPVASVYDTSMQWPGPIGPVGDLVDLAVTVGKLPAGAAHPSTTIRQIIAADGTLEGCAIDRSSGSPALDRLACKQAEGLAKMGPVKDASGKAVRTMRVQRVMFEGDAGG